MQLVDGVCGGFAAVGSFGGKIVDTLVEGSYGLGTIHARMLRLGESVLDKMYSSTWWVLQSNPVQLAIEGGLAYFFALKCPLFGSASSSVSSSGNTTTFSKVYNPNVTWVERPKQAMTAVFIFSTFLYAVLATRVFFKPLTSEMAKQCLSKGVLLAVDSCMLFQATRQESRLDMKLVEGAYFGARIADLLLSGGHDLEALVRFNPEPCSKWIRIEIKSTKLG